MKYFISTILIAIIYSSSTAQPKLNERDMLMLKSFMAGNFSSELQAKNDTNYFNIVLHMAPIWSDKKDGFWLYVEQAVATSQEKPYRQRIYHVALKDDSTITSDVFEMKSPLRFTGAWKNAELISSLTTDSLISRDGCTIYLHKNKDGSFRGKTGDKTCTSNLRGASFATSEVIIKRDLLLSWDRGWDVD
ncbi:MAG: chromophore lyase CpcT/CpeT, partial [Chitinophagales bacterium]|nr:chromophore lyase CpcT/CpeT [Chitinophagales bacterium]